MFFVFGKQKMYSYIIAASTVIILFILSFFFINVDINSIETSANSINETKTIENLVDNYE